MGNSCCSPKAEIQGKLGSPLSLPPSLQRALLPHPRLFPITDFPIILFFSLRPSCRIDRMPETPPPSRRRDLTASTSRGHRHNRSPAPNAQGSSSARSRMPTSPARSTSSASPGQEIMVDAIFSGHSDGILVILRMTTSSSASSSLSYRS